MRYLQHNPAWGFQRIKFLAISDTLPFFIHSLQPDGAACSPRAFPEARALRHTLPLFCKKPFAKGTWRLHLNALAPRKIWRIA